MAQFGTIDAGRPAWQSRRRRLLDLHLHQLAAHAALHPRVGRAISRSGPGGDRRPHAGVPLRARSRQRPPRGARDAVTYPVAIDNDYAVWQAFSNHYWPALYLIDAEGRIRHHQFGEGDYEEAERNIQQLLVEAGHDERRCRTWSRWMPVGLRSPPIGRIWRRERTTSADERTEGFASPGGAVLGDRRAYSTP